MRLVPSYPLLFIQFVFIIQTELFVNNVHILYVQFVHVLLFLTYLLSIVSLHNAVFFDEFADFVLTATYRLTLIFVTVFDNG